MKLGKLGIWGIVDTMNAADAAAFAQRVEKWGYGALWIPEGFGRDALVSSSWLLANTKKLNIATGIATTYARDALAAKSGQYALAEHSGGRFLLGLGVSHGPIVEGRGHKYEKPIPTMKAYLEAMQKGKYMAVPPAETPLTVIAALGPKMLEVAGSSLADGAHPYNVSPEHTAYARKILGPGKLLCPEQMVLLETDAAKARAIGRRVLGMYLTLPNYRNNFLRFGFTEADMDNGGSDKLIDSTIAWGDEKAIRKRIQEHWDAGADHVCIQSLAKEGHVLTKADEKIFELLAPG